MPSKEANQSSSLNETCPRCGSSDYNGKYCTNCGFLK